MASWLTVIDRTQIRAYWPSVDELDDEALAPLLASAATQCEAYAPAQPVGTPVPRTWQHAQALQARALYRSGIAGSQDQIGGDGMSVTVFPMDWTVKRLLRPQRGTVWVR